MIAEMTLDSWAQLMTIVSGIATVVALLFVAFELHRNTIVHRASVYLQLTGHMRDSGSWFVSSQISDIYDRGLQDPSALEGEESVRFDTIMYSMFNDFEMLDVQEHCRVISADFAAGWFDWLEQEVVCHPGVRLWWREKRRFYQPKFAERIDAAVERMAIESGQL